MIDTEDRQSNKFSNKEISLAKTIKIHSKSLCIPSSIFNYFQTNLHMTQTRQDFPQDRLEKSKPVLDNTSSGLITPSLRRGCIDMAPTILAL